MKIKANWIKFLLIRIIEDKTKWYDLFLCSIAVLILDYIYIGGEDTKK